MSNKYEATFHPSDGPMSAEEIRNQCEDDADRAPSDLTVWRDRGAIIAAQQTRIAQLEAEIADRELTETDTLSRLKVAETRLANVDWLAEVWAGFGATPVAYHWDKLAERIWKALS